jgi:V/A-type H+-transporting ATPase subunit E
MTEQEQALAQEILADARRRADRLKQRAEREAQRIIAEAGKETQTARELALAAARRHVAHERAVSEARTAQEMARLRLELRQEAIDGVRTEVSRRLAALAVGPEHKEVLKGLALLAIEAMSGERFRLVLRREDGDTWGPELAAEVCAAAERELARRIQVDLSENTLTGMGGLVVEGADGREWTDCGTGCGTG